MPPRREHFTLDEIETGIRKFKRRIDEVKALDPTKIHYKAPQVEAATRNIRADLRDVFGEGSPEYNAHFRKSVSYPGVALSGMGPAPPLTASSAFTPCRR